MTLQSARPRRARRVTPRIGYEEFLATAYENEHREWVNGKVIEMPPVSDEHADVNGYLIALVRFYAEARNLGVVRAEPFQMKTGPELPGRAPDLLFVANENLPRLQKNFLDGPADLAVEIISPESRTRDRGEKFYEYEAGGVREYWLLDPIRKQAEFYQRDANGIFQLVPPDADGVYHSAVLPGLWLRVAWLFLRPLPPLLDVLRAWKLV